MIRRSSPRLLAVAASLAMALVVAVPASAAPLAVDSARTGAAAASGPATDFVHMRGIDVAGSPALTQFEVRAANILVHQYTTSYYEGAEVPLGPGESARPIATPRMPLDPSPTVYRTADGTLSYKGAQGGYIINVFSQKAFQLLTSPAAVEVRMLPDPELTERGIQEGLGGAAGTQGPTFSVQQTSGARVHVATEDPVDVEVLGDLVLEVRGVTLDLKGRGDTGQLYSGTDRRGLTGTSADAAAQERTDTFLRIFLTGAVLQAKVSQAGAMTEWTQRSTTLSLFDEALLERHDGGLDVVPAGATLRLDALSGTMAASWAAGGSDPSSVAVAGDLGAKWMWFVGGLAVVSLLVAAAVAVRSARQTPSMDEVEEAMENGAFRRAAALAGRISRRRPNLEAAVLSRAIALARSGRHARVVQEVKPYVEGRDPSDGALHYVLGLAFMDLGRREEGAAALWEAARRTPDLRGDVESRLGAAPVAPREVSGYV